MKFKTVGSGAAAALALSLVYSVVLAQPVNNRDTHQFNSNPCALDQSTTVNIHSCINQKFEKADKILNVVYKSLMQKLSLDRKIELRDAEREWLTRTKQKCTADAKYLEGGSDWPIEYESCYLAETEAQTAHLRKLAQ